MSDQLADAWDRGVFSTLSECLGDGIEFEDHEVKALYAKNPHRENVVPFDSERATRLLNCLLRIVREADHMRSAYRMDGQTADMEYDKVRAELDGLL